MGCLRLERLEETTPTLKVIHRAVDNPKNLSRNYYPYGMRHSNYERTALKNNYQYNGIEHVGDFGLDLNMATYRSLDAALGQWGQVDPAAESLYGMTPYNSMAGNPISYTDPDGDFIPAAILGAGIGLVTNGVGNIANGNGFFDGALQAMAIGAVGGAASFGIGQATSALSTTGANLSAMGISNSLGSLATLGNFAGHAALGGLSSMASGGDFGSGALSGSFGAGAGMAFGGSAAGTLIGGGLSGGVGSSIAGGSFWQGAGQGLISAGLNHGAHNGAFGGGLQMALMTGRTRHLWKADAYALSGNMSAAVGGSFRMEGGTVMATVGKDAWKPKLFSELGFGVGVDAGAGAGLTKFYFSGRAKNFRLRMLQGVSQQQNLSGALFGANLGGSVSFTRVDYNKGIYGVGVSLGATIPSPFKAGYTYEWPTTYIYD